ncbi:MAG TPA: hypothetical protein VI756_26035 [Blastocatellia bacterium]
MKNKLSILSCHPQFSEEAARAGAEVFVVLIAGGLDSLESGSGRVLAASKGRITRSRRTTKSRHGS